MFFFRFGCGDAFCTDTFLQTDGVTHRSLYTEQLLRADILTQRVLCTKNFCTQTPLHTEVFTQRRKCFVQRCFFAHINKGTQAFLHTEPFPQRSLCTEQFSHMFFLHKKPLTQRNLYTQIAHRSFYRPTFFGTHKFYPELFLPRFFFLHRKPLCTKNNIHSSFYRQTVFAQKVLHTEVLRTEGFTYSIILHTDAFTHRCLYTGTNCTQKLVHTARVYTQPTFTQRGFASCFLDHLHFVFPLSSGFSCQQMLKIIQKNP